MKIVKLTAENVKKLTAVEITPTGELVEITGKNGAGKSSVLDSIWWALAGTKHIQAVPIRKGETKARIRLDLGELIVERRFSEKGSTLTVEKADGARYGSPQAVLDALLGALAFDPLAFVGQEPDDQLDTLKGMVKLDVDPDHLDALNAGDYAKRTDVSRDAKAKRAQADGIQVAAKLPEAPIDTTVLLDRITDAAKTNGEIDRQRLAREQRERDIQVVRDIAVKTRQTALERRADAAQLIAEAEQLEARAVQVDAQAVAGLTALQAEPDLAAPVDVDEVRAELNLAEATNREIEKRTRKAALIVEAEGLLKLAADLTANIEARDKTKAEAIAAAKMPVPGLGFGAGCVTFDGLPFAQASTAEQLRVSVAIAMAANPKLRVLRIKEGSLLDVDNLALIAAMAKEHDYQIWVERVDTSGKVGILIEDGHVAAVDGEPVAAK